MRYGYPETCSTASSLLQGPGRKFDAKGKKKSLQVLVGSSELITLLEPRLHRSWGQEGIGQFSLQRAAALKLSKAEFSINASMHLKYFI